VEVDRVKVSLRYAQLLGNGNWKTVEVEAEGAVSPKESWQQAQSYLYAELQRQVVELFKLPEAKLEAATIRPAPLYSQEVSDLARRQTEPAQQLEQPMGGPLAHWCVSHAEKFDKHTKGSQEWYSHKIEGTGEWCRE